MIVDASALVAIVFQEPESDRFAERIATAVRARIAAPTLLEAAIVVERSERPQEWRALDRLVAALGLDVEPFTNDHTEIARDAYRRYGKGQGHPAQLDFGDCISYALAKATGEPLLYKGDDFAHTDIRSALE